jgi:hypothetical protein
MFVMYKNKRTNQDKETSMKKYKATTREGNKKTSGRGRGYLSHVNVAFGFKQWPLRVLPTVCHCVSSHAKITFYIYSG